MLASSFPEVCEPRYVSLQVCSEVCGEAISLLSFLLEWPSFCQLPTLNPPGQPSFGPLPRARPAFLGAGGYGPAP